MEERLHSDPLEDRGGRRLARVRHRVAMTARAEERETRGDERPIDPATANVLEHDAAHEVSETFLDDDPRGPDHLPVELHAEEVRMPWGCGERALRYLSVERFASLHGPASEIRRVPFVDRREIDLDDIHVRDWSKREIGHASHAAHVPAREAATREAGLEVRRLRPWA